MPKPSSGTHLTIVRHGETAWNASGRWQGHADIALTDVGRAQARALAERLRGECFTAVYSSDLERARETAAILTGGRSDIHLDPALREIHVGALEGHSSEEFHQLYPEIAAAYFGGEPEAAPPGGESNRAFITRVGQCLDQIAARHPGARILISAHGGVCRSWMIHALGLPQGICGRLAVPNCGLNRFSLGPRGWKLECWGEVAHLGDPAARATL